MCPCSMNLTCSDPTSPRTRSKRTRKTRTYKNKEGQASDSSFVFFPSNVLVHAIRIVPKASVRMSTTSKGSPFFALHVGKEIQIFDKCFDRTNVSNFPSSFVGTFELDLVSIGCNPLGKDDDRIQSTRWIPLGYSRRIHVKIGSYRSHSTRRNDR